MRTPFIIVLIFFCSFQLFAQLKPIQNSLSETWYDKVPVSGEIRAGLMTEIDCSEYVKGNFFIKLPTNHNTKFLNIDISSNDGRYLYTAHYDIEGEHGIIEVIRDTKILKKLSNYKCSDLAILAWINDDPKEEKETFVLANWEPNLESEIVTIFLNSSNKAVLNYKDKETNESVTTPCQTITDQANVAFNCQCQISMDKLENSSEISIVQRVRRSQVRHSMKIKF